MFFFRLHDGVHCCELCLGSSECQWRLGETHRGGPKGNGCLHDHHFNQAFELGEGELPFGGRGSTAQHEHGGQYHENGPS